MPPIILLLVLSAAVMHASWNALVKVGGDPLARLALVNLACSALAIPVLAIAGLPDAASLPYLAISVVVHNAYYGLLTLSYQVGDLSYVYPLARGSAPLIVAVMAFVFAGEQLSLPGMLAVATICVAILSLALTGRGNGRHGWKATSAALATGLSIACYTNSDGLGARASGNPIAYVSMLFFLEGLPLIGFLWLARRHALSETLRAAWRPGLVGGALAFLGYGIVVWSFAHAPITLVSAVREVSVVIAAMIGVRMLGEPFGLRRVAAAAAVVLGIVLLDVSPA
jgi:drug/metabolite transporter (DMT)-like permease